MDLNELRAANVARCEEVFHPLNAWSPTDWATALGGEAGEALNAVKKLRRLADGNNTAKDPQTEAEAVRDVGEELADTIIYADLLAARLGIDLAAAIREKFNRVSDLRGSTVFLRDVHEDMTSQALRDVLIERRRQVYGEGYEAGRDDQHTNGELAQAAACYVLASQNIPVACGSSSIWPWSAEHWKPGDRRHNLIRATALMFAELERMYRAEAAGAGTDRPKITLPQMCQKHQHLLVKQAGYAESDPWRALIIASQIALFQAASTDQKIQQQCGGDVTKFDSLGCLACHKPDAFGEIVEAAKSHDLGRIKALGERWVNDAQAKPDGCSRDGATASL